MIMRVVVLFLKEYSGLPEKTDVKFVEITLKLW